MFCSHCGSQVPDGAAFCAACGTPAGQQAVAQTAVQQPVMQQPQVVYQAAAPAAPSAASLMFKDFLNMVKGFFSKNAMKTVGVEAKSTGLEWIVALGLSVLVFTFASLVNVIQLTGDAFAFIKLFGFGLLTGLVAAGATFGALWLVMTVILKKKVSLMAILNLIGMATLPLTVCQLLNMLLGLIWFPLVLIASGVALMMAVVILYVGMQKMEKLDNSPFYPFVLGAAMVTLVVGLLGYLLYQDVPAMAVSYAALGELDDMMGGMMGGLGDLGSMMGGLGDLGSMF